MDTHPLFRSSRGTQGPNHHKVRGSSRAGKHSKSAAKLSHVSSMKPKSSSAKASFSKMLDDLSLGSFSTTDAAQSRAPTLFYALVGLPPRKFVIEPSFLQLPFFKNPDSVAAWTLESDSIRLPFKIPEVFAALLEFFAKGDYVPHLREVIVELAPQAPPSPMSQASSAGSSVQSPVKDEDTTSRLTIGIFSPVARSTPQSREGSVTDLRRWPDSPVPSVRTGHVNAPILPSPTPSIRFTTYSPRSTAAPRQVALRLGHQQQSPQSRINSPGVGLDNAALSRWGLGSRLTPLRPIDNWQSPHLAASDTSSVAECDSISVFSRDSKASHKTATTYSSAPRSHASQISPAISPTSTRISKSRSPMQLAKGSHGLQNQVATSRLSTMPSTPMSPLKRFCTSLTLDGHFMADAVYLDRRGNGLHKELLVYLAATKFGIPTLQEKAINKLAIRINVADEVLIRSAAVCYDPAYGVGRAKGLFVNHMTRLGTRFVNHNALRELAEQGCALRSDLLRSIWTTRGNA